MVDKNLLDSVAAAMSSTFVTKAELVDYLHDQADELRQATEAGEEGAEHVPEVAGRLAEIAQRSDLPDLAVRLAALAGANTAGD